MVGTIVRPLIPMPEPIIYNRKEKWVILPNEHLSLMPLIDADIDMLKGSIDGKKATKFEIGKIYSLGIDPIEGIEFDKIYFVVCGIVTEYKGVNLDSLIVREVDITKDGEIIESINPSKRRKFSIPPSMCKLLGIKYTPGFELWPMSSGFEKVDVEKVIGTSKEIDYKNLSTYPTSMVDGTVRNIILELHGFSPFNNTHIITPTGAMIPTDFFTSSLTIYLRQNISTDNGCAGFKAGEKLPFKIVTRENSSKNISLCDDKHNIYVSVDLTRKSLNVNTEDGLIGVSHTSLDGKDIDDVIGVKWDESTDENAQKYKEKEMSMTDIDKVFDALDKHFSRMNKMFDSRASRFSDIQLF